MKNLILILILAPFFTQAQNLTGFWRGKLTQDAGGYAPEYALEINIVQKKKNFYGETNAYLGKVVVAKLNFTGYFEKDSIYLIEYKEGIIEKVLPPKYLLCIKNFILSYQKNSIGIESLIGRWDGIAEPEKVAFGDYKLLDSTKNEVENLPCIPGLIFLSKNDQLHIETKTPTQLMVFPDTLYETRVNKIKEIEVENPIVEIAISDYEEVDGDEVSVMLNRLKVADKMQVRKRPINFTLTLNANYINNELLIFAENLGKIPPNTSFLVIKDGDKRHEIYISSDLKNTTAIYLKYKPKEH